MRRLPSWVGLALALLTVSGTASAQEGLLQALTGGSEPERQGVPELAEPAAPEPPPEEVLPGSSEVIPRLLALEAEAEEVRRTLAAVRQASDLTTEMDALEERLAEVRGQLATPPGASLDGDRLLSLRSRAARTLQRLEGLLAATSDRYRLIEGLRRRWREQRRFYARWREALAADPAHPELAGDLATGLSRVAEVESEIAAATPAVLSAQRRVQALLLNSRHELLRIDALVGEWKARLLRPTDPVLLSPAFWRQLAGDLGEPLSAGLERARLDPAFLLEHAPTLAAQGLVALLVALLARRLRRAAGDEPSRPGLLSHPWALGVFAAVAAFSDFSELAPGAWRLAVAAALAASLCLLAQGTFPRRRQRRAVYLLAALYLIFRSAEVLGLPASLLRLVLAGLCLAPLPFILGLAAREVRERGRLTPFAALLRLAAAVLAVVALANAAGYAPLAAWVLDAAIQTTFIAFAATFSIRLGRKLVRLALGAPLGDRPTLVPRLRAGLGRRLAWVLRVVAVGAALLWIADVWNLAASPIEAWQAVARFRLGFGDSPLRLGQLLLAAAAFWLSLVASWVLRAVFDEQFVSRRGLERGVGNAVKTLLHYTLVVFGLLLALSFAGFELQNLAIVAGALGVGIGFGLQNVVNNFVSGLILLFERPVRVGDTAVLGEDSGVVQRIGLRSTVVQTFDRAEVIVPNSQLISEKVINWTLSGRIARLTVPVGVAYGSDLGRVQAILEQVAHDHGGLLAEPPPAAVLTGFGDSAIDFELRVWLANVDDRPRIQSELLRALADRLGEAGVEIPFPQRDLHLRSVAEEAARRLRPGAKPDETA